MELYDGAAYVDRWLTKTNVFYYSRKGIKREAKDINSSYKAN